MTAPPLQGPTQIDLNSLLKGDHDLKIGPKENAEERTARLAREALTHKAMIVMLFAIGGVLIYLACASTKDDIQRLAVNGLVALVVGAIGYVAGSRKSAGN